MNSYKMQIVDCALKISGMNFLWYKSSEAYKKLRNSNSFITRAFGTLETVFGNAIEKSLPSNGLCSCFNLVEINLPVIKKEPKQILSLTKSVFIENMRLTIETIQRLKQEAEQKLKIIKLQTYYRAHYFRIYSWQQADKVMSTETGMNILETVDNTTCFAESILNRYLPPLLDEEDYSAEHECSEHAKLHHTVTRLSNFSNKASKRVYLALMERLQHMYKIEIFVLILHALIMIQIIRFFETILLFIYNMISDFLPFT